MKNIPDYHIELYKVAVASAETVSGRRSNANSFFLTLQTGLASVLGYLSTNTILPQSVKPIGVTISAVIGLILCLSWWLLLRSYRDLNDAKYKVIQKLEKEFDVKPFTEEWEVLKKDPIKKWGKRYAEFTSVERLIPSLFALIYTFIIIGVWVYR